jgi:uncharacterized protein (DUF58 family)
VALKSNDFRSYLDPLVISRIKSLEFKARAIVEGFMVGLHKSPYHGFSVEFSEHRPYMQGDPIKNIDWKVYAKREKFFIKQYEEETNLICNIFLDISKSMDFKYASSVTKLDYAVTLAASFCYLLIKQQDAVGLTIFSDKIHSYLPPKSNRVYLKTLLTSLTKINALGKTATSLCLNDAAEKIKKRGLTIIISDLFDNPGSILSALKQLRYKKNEVIVFQILDPVERNFGFDKDTIFVDLETKEELTTQPYQIRSAYQSSMNEFINKLKNGCLNYGIEFNLIGTNQPFDKALLNYFSKRSKMN